MLSRSLLDKKAFKKEVILTTNPQTEQTGKFGFNDIAS